MNGNWGKVILFSILFCVLGFILGRVTSGGCGPSSCDRDGMRGTACAHEGMKGEGRSHGMKGKCCAMDADSTAVPDSTSHGH